ncbi:hypothetical protein [Streptomyces sp. NPDC046759]|uniref:hypothetical protein n=1 Tax=Streptomyces sp. NPDC046759 TaxID=3155019 RepID=UPI0034054CCF
MVTRDTPLRSPAPRWAVRAAHLVAPAALPTGVWRLLLASGNPAGYTEAGYKALDATGWGAACLIGLSLSIEALALLTLALVRPRGEVIPHFVPRIGGRRVHPSAVTLVGGICAVVLTALWSPFLLWWAVPHPDLTPLGNAVIGFLYLPLIAWGPLLGAVTLSYHRRHRTGGGPEHEASADT